MGLDMYLYAKLSLSELDQEEKAKIESIQKLFPETRLVQFQNIDISFKVGYWWKAVSIHEWFVDYADDINGDQYTVDRETLEKLLFVCKNKKKVLRASPEDIIDTIKIIEECLKLPEKYTFEYQASW